MTSVRRRPASQGNVFWFLCALARRRTIAVFLVVFLILECALLLLHQHWLPDAPLAKKHASGMRFLELSPGMVKTESANHRPQQRVAAKASVVKQKQTTAFVKQQSSLGGSSTHRNMVANAAIGTSKVRGAGAISNSNSRIAPNQNGQFSLAMKKINHKKQMAAHKKIARKKGQKQQQQPRGWDPGDEGRNKEPTPLKVETPIFVASLPKSGTTSIWQYFNCGARSASHQWVKNPNNHTVLAGVCIRNNVNMGRPPFDGCGPYDVFADTGFSTFVSKGVSDCYYPSISALPAIYEHYPHATIVMIVRNSTAWLHSTQAHGEGSLFLRWRNCQMASHVPSNNENIRQEDDPDGFRAFYEWHTEHVRNFAAQHPSLTYIEVSLESPTTGHILEEKIGIPAGCWGRCTSYSKFCQPVS